MKMTELASSDPELDSTESVWMRGHSGPLPNSGGDSIARRSGLRALV